MVKTYAVIEPQPDSYYSISITFTETVGRMLSIRKINTIFIVTVLLVSITGVKLVWNQGYNSLLTEHTLQLDRFSSHITTTIDKYAHLPRLLAKDKTLIDALSLQKNSAQIDITNRYLNEINEIINASDTYLLNQNGTTIASSNWKSRTSFIGRNFSWRPYFAEAIKGIPSQYFALGSTSGTRGYYYSSPIQYAGSIIGVIVVKVDLSSIEEHWKSDSSYFIATDQNQIIFMSSQSEWLFKSTAPLTEIQKRKITISRQYLDQPITQLPIEGDTNATHTEWNDKDKPFGLGDYIVSSKSLANIPLVIRVLSPKTTLFWSEFYYLAIVMMASVICYLSLLLIYSRQARQRQLAQIQTEARQKLEYQVMERTASLHNEISERKKTEQQLRQTQEELIQAAKLAVLGQMSASVSHELNNPLAAIRSFADNGRRFLDKEKYERVEENLIRISSLTERMAKISTQLKSFSRRAGQEPQVIKLLPVIESARELMIPQLKSNRVSLTLNPVSEDVLVNIDPIQLEQVIVNLLANAIQALERQEPKCIELTVETLENRVLIHIDDNGHGIDPNTGKHLFEPFFTTKKNGLGLGLSISLQIMEAMHGDIQYSSSRLGGTRFSIQLPSVTSHTYQGAD